MSNDVMSREDKIELAALRIQNEELTNLIMGLVKRPGIDVRFYTTPSLSKDVDRYQRSLEENLDKRIEGLFTNLIKERARTHHKHALAISYASMWCPFEYRERFLQEMYEVQL